MLRDSWVAGSDVLNNHLLCGYMRDLSIVTFRFPPTIIYTSSMGGFFQPKARTSNSCTGSQWYRIRVERTVHIIVRQHSPYASERVSEIIGSAGTVKKEKTIVWRFMW